MKTDKTIVGLDQEYVLPSIKRRYISMLIDLFIVLGAVLGLLHLFDIQGNQNPVLRGLIILIPVMLYEPILISYACTIGQWITHIRVRSLRNVHQRVNIFRAILRMVVKSALGWISLLYISFNADRRAIHDFAADSVVVEPKG